MSNIQKDSTIESWKHITYKELIVMPIEKRKVIAEQIVASGVLNRPIWTVQGWGRFKDLPVLSEDQIQQEAASLVATMTLEQKIGQMTPNTTVEQYIPACLKYNDFPYVSGDDADLDIPGMRFSDGPTGVVMGNASTCFPVSMARAATWDPGLEQRIGEALGNEARSLGANLFGGVCVNLLRHPCWGRSQETYGEDPCLLGVMGSSLVRGVQKYTMACVKHFALNSMENTRYKVNVSIDERTLRELYLPHFKACVDEGVAAVMTAYNKVRGTYCGENDYLIRQILKNEWNFKGIVISDFIFGLYDGSKAAQAGLDIEMPIEGLYGKNLLAVVRHGLVSEKVIDEAAVRILATKIRFSQTLGSEEIYVSQLANPTHIALAHEAALKSAVLLKNTDNILPLDQAIVKRIAILGVLAAKPNIGEMKGSSHVYPPYVVTPLDGLLQMVGSTTTDVTHCINDGIYSGNDVLITYHKSIMDHQAEEFVREADAVIIVVGLTSDDEGEYIPHWDSGCGGDRSHLMLNAKDLDLIVAASVLNPRSIVVLQGGGAIITDPWDAQVAAILMTWYPGMEGGHALAKILFGKFNPCGKLPLTIPRSMDQLPYFNKDALEVAYDYFHGYFQIDRDASEVPYPFGFGLSYTSFAFAHMQIEKNILAEDGILRVSVEVTNTGLHDGETVVQLYVGCELSQILRHKKDLRGFSKVSLKAGEMRVVSFSLPVSHLEYWDEMTNGWKIELTSYTVFVGSSSAYRDLLSTSFEIR